MTLLRPGWTSGRRPASGLSLHVVEAGPADGPLLILLHGFPEFWWAWRHQITPLAEAGYHVVVPDMRGYNGSDAPQDVGSYRLDALVADVLALADGYGAERFRLVGHDWGAIVAWAVGAGHSGRLERLRMQGRHTGEFNGTAATDRRIDVEVMDLFRVADGRLVEHWALMDNLTMLKQIGAIDG